MSRTKISKARSYAVRKNDSRMSGEMEKRIMESIRRHRREMKYKGRKGGCGVNVAKRGNKK
jgi:hypothetical protein